MSERMRGRRGHPCKIWIACVVAGLAASAIPRAVAADPAPKSTAGADGPESSESAVEPQADPVLPSLPGVVVTAPRLPEDGMTTPLSTSEVTLSPRIRARTLDAAELLENTPGTAAVRNGALTGIAQQRGLFGDRVRVLVDDMTITPACANHMDPPLHYAAPGSVEAMRSVAGVTPVSLGGDSIAGTIVVDSAPPRFAEGDELRITAEGTSRFVGSQNSFGLNGVFGLADRRFSAAYTGSWQTANDLRFPGGRVQASEFDVQHHGLLLATQQDWGQLALDLGGSLTDEAGTPALRMDIARDESRRIGLRFHRELGFGALEARLYWHDIDHRMDNFSLRELAPGAMPMESPAESRDLGYRLALSIPLSERHELRVGSELHASRFDSEIRNLANGQLQTGIPDGRRNRLGSFVEWERRWNDHWQTLVGVRNDTVWSDTDDVSQSFRPMNPMMAAAIAADREAFNTRGRGRTEINWDASALLRFEPREGQRYELGVARKVRSPSLLERYQWTPLAASAGMADGWLYFGNIDLEPETAYQVALAGHWIGQRAELHVAPFYTWVHDYIQGSPEPGRVDPATGFSVLRYRNFDNVQLYGVDASGSWQLHDRARVRGFASYVRGRNRSSDDDLYRVMPLHGTLDLDVTWRDFTATTGLEWAIQQDQTSSFNDEPNTPGYALWNLALAWKPHRRLHLLAGLDNVLDKRFAPHTNGLNSVLESDLEVGERIPGAGRFFHASLTIAY
ncbi:TonB-dependent receptor [Myxococcota bacterium]|nr:TonB-dependent receptor [Myxococcota bacterium]MCZ7617479.1 TonB-dependent receptor [Myxococcota bacterium]